MSEADHESVKSDSNSPFVVPPPGLGILDSIPEDVYALITHGHLDHVGQLGNY